MKFVHELDERTELGFIKEVTNQLKFLVEEFGFKQVEATNYLVRYRKAKEYLEIYHERISYEIYVVIRIKDDFGNDYEALLEKILESKGLSSRLGFYQASTKNAISHAIQEIASCLKLYATEFLLGDIEAFQKVKGFSDEQLTTLSKQEKLLSVEKEADLAWRNKEYRKLITLYSSIENELTEIQKRKLLYAKGKLNG